MRYKNICRGVFLSRPNRFIAIVEIDGQKETVHVKNTGRCRELLVPGAEVWLSRSDNTARKTKNDLIAVRKNSSGLRARNGSEEKNGGVVTARQSRLQGENAPEQGERLYSEPLGVLFNIDSQAPNVVVGEWLEQQGFDRIVPEYRFGQSRIDFYMERSSEKYLLEVKGCTLERDGVGYFPDAPTERGTKHLRELLQASAKGYHAAVAFVMQADNMTTVLPNAETDPAFAAAFEDAKQAGVHILCLPCHVEPDRLEIAGGVRYPC